MYTVYIALFLKLIGLTSLQNTPEIRFTKYSNSLIVTFAELTLLAFMWLTSTWILCPWIYIFRMSDQIIDFAALSY